MSMRPSPNLPLVHTDDYAGYLYDDIITYLSHKDMQRKEFFDKWYRGQTGVMHEGKMLVFAWDWERFLRGQEPLD